MRTSRTAFSIRREEGMRVDAMMGEAEGEDEKTLMIQSLRAMVDGLKRQVASDSSLPLPRCCLLGRACSRCI